MGSNAVRYTLPDVARQSLKTIGALFHRLAGRFGVTTITGFAMTSSLLLAEPLQERADPIEARMVVGLQLPSSLSTRLHRSVSVAHDIAPKADRIGSVLQHLSEHRLMRRCDVEGKAAKT